MNPKTYVVKGIAFVPCETEIHVEATGEAEAMELSRRTFDKEKRRCIVGNSYDDASVHSYQPNQADVLK